MALSDTPDVPNIEQLACRGTRVEQQEGAHVVWLAAVRIGGCVPGIFICDCILRRSPLDLSQSTTAATLCLWPGAWRVLHYMDILRRRRNGRPRGLGLLTDLRRANAGLFACTPVSGASCRSWTRPQSRFDRRLYRFAFWQEPIACSASDSDRR